MLSLCWSCRDNIISREGSIKDVPIKSSSNNVVLTGWSSDIQAKSYKYNKSFWMMFYFWRTQQSNSLMILLPHANTVVDHRSLSLSTFCRYYCYVLARHGPRGQRAVPGGGAGEGYVRPRWRLLLLHHSDCQPDWCQWQWAHIPAPWVTYTLWVILI